MQHPVQSQWLLMLLTLIVAASSTTTTGGHRKLAHADVTSAYDVTSGTHAEAAKPGLSAALNRRKRDDENVSPAVQLLFRQPTKQLPPGWGRHRTLGSGKRASYGFGLGRRAYYGFGLGKRAYYGFGLGKRASHLGLGGRASYDSGSNKRQAYGFGLGKRSWGWFEGPTRDLLKRPSYGFGLGKRSASGGRPLPLGGSTVAAAQLLPEA